MFHFVLVCLIACTTSVFCSELEIFAKFSSLNYTWDKNHTYSDYLVNKQYIVENCLLAGINVGRNGDIYVTVPRWKNGVPGTLNKLESTDSGEYLLNPFPSWDMQREGVDGDLQNVQSMTIDKKNRMWVIDVGREYFYTKTKKTVNAAAGVWLIDLNLDIPVVIDKYYFPKDVVSFDNSFLNDVVVDDTLDIAYFTDAWDDGAIIVFDLASRSSKRFSGVSTANDKSYRMVIDGHKYGNKIFTTPSDGIAITEDYSALFFCQVQGTTLYRVPTSFLRESSGDDMSAFNTAVEVLGRKEPSDGIKYLDGTLFWGALTESTLYSMQISATSLPDMNLTASQMFPPNTETMQWLDTFAIDLSVSSEVPNRLYFVSNKLNLFTTGKMDFDDKDAGNMHIMRVTI